MRTRSLSLLALGTAVAVALGVAACNKDSNMAPTTPLLSQAQADSIAKTVVADVAAEIVTATMDGAGSGAVASVSASAPAPPAGSATVTQCLPAKSPTP